MASRYASSLSVEMSAMLLFTHFRSVALQFFPASDIATASGEYLVTMSCIAIIFSALAIPPCMFIDWRQNLFSSVLLSPLTVNTVAWPMSTSVLCERATYLAQADATRVDRVPAAAISASVPDSAKAEGS